MQKKVQQAKLINEFGSKLYKTKNLYEGNRKLCDQFRKECEQLEATLNELNLEKDKVVETEMSLKEQLIEYQTAYKE